jgi:hypothetical protein
MFWFLYFWAVAAAGTFANVGDVVGDATVLHVVSHDEFERVLLALPDGRELQVEITAAFPGASGACDLHGLTVQPRWALLGEEIEVEDQPASILALCDRVQARGKRVAFIEPQAHVEVDPERIDARIVEPQPARRMPVRPLHGVLFALGKPSFRPAATDT